MIAFLPESGFAAAGVFTWAGRSAIQKCPQKTGQLGVEMVIWFEWAEWEVFMGHQPLGEWSWDWEWIDTGGRS